MILNTGGIILSLKSKAEERRKDEKQKADRRATAIYKWINGMKKKGISKPTKIEIYCFETGFNMAWNDK